MGGGRPGLSLALVASLLAISPAAAAAPTTPPADARAPTDTRAVELFNESARAYREGRFQAAVDLLLEARRLKAEPVLLYDLGRAYEALGKPAEAADAYAKYLDEDPNAPDRRAIEGRIGTLRAQAAELEAARRPPEPAREPEKPPPPRPTSDGLGAVPWIIAGAGVVAIGTGLVIGGVAQGKHDDAVSARVQRDADQKQSSAETLATVSTITIVAGAVVAAVGLAWAGIRLAQPKKTLARTPWLLEGSF